MKISLFFHVSVEFHFNVQAIWNNLRFFYSSRASIRNVSDLHRKIRLLNFLIFFPFNRFWVGQTMFLSFCWMIRNLDIYLFSVIFSRNFFYVLFHQFSPQQCTIFSYSTKAGRLSLKYLYIELCGFCSHS